jgi:hypothetical protein
VIGPAHGQYTKCHAVLAHFLLLHFEKRAAEEDGLERSQRVNALNHLVNAPYQSLLYHGETCLHFAVM